MGETIFLPLANSCSSGKGPEEVFQAYLEYAKSNGNKLLYLHHSEVITKKSLIGHDVSEAVILAKGAKKAFLAKVRDCGQCGDESSKPNWDKEYKKYIPKDFQKTYKQELNDEGHFWFELYDVEELSKYISEGIWYKHDNPEQDIVKSLNSQGIVYGKRYKNM
ncbi:Uncharacterised protein [Streptococcus cristatus]|uniref:Uncharacterized protein n=2 Tax=Streptococcus cristatus TaxID=45634 RepID=A0A512ADM6_STRCR|nr:hypothetical protein [Streptococcus cristatus]AGK71812.1 hypothetical protein I872_08660 [Streptococcus cristatus AS 1.3089]GEN97791.1 hypothetical protein SOL01_16650 [Streptococcus cristatus]SQI48867.1 Uncharacterised protein [Streptococcus cristatus]